MLLFVFLKSFFILMFFYNIQTIHIGQLPHLLLFGKDEYSYSELVFYMKVKYYIVLTTFMTNNFTFIATLIR
jgi:hypothetical protein